MNKKISMVEMRNPETQKHLREMLELQIQDKAFQRWQDSGSSVQQRQRRYVEYNGRRPM